MKLTAFDLGQVALVTAFVEAVCASSVPVANCNLARTAHPTIQVECNFSAAGVIAMAPLDASGCRSVCSRTALQLAEHIVNASEARGETLLWCAGNPK